MRSHLRQMAAGLRTMLDGTTTMPAAELGDRGDQPVDGARRPLTEGPHGRRAVSSVAEGRLNGQPVRMPTRAAIPRC